MQQNLSFKKKSRKYFQKPVYAESHKDFGA